MSKRLRAGDEAIVIAGNDRGRTGKVLSCDGDRVIIEGINVRKKHMKRTQQNQKGQIIDIERPIHISNVSLCVDGKPVKLKARFNEDGSKQLYYRADNQDHNYRPVKKNKG